MDSEPEARFGRILQAHGPSLRRLASAYARDSSDADDLLQDICFAIWRALPGFRGECSERTFVFRIGHNRGLSFRMRQRLVTELDEDLAEALALAHDLGHPPFGHAGERALAAAMAAYGGFDHNAQSFKVVTRLERKYASFDGLNLTLETLEGLAKHNGPLVGRERHQTVLWQAITDAGLAQLEGLTNLSVLALAHTRVTDAGILALRLKLPGLDIQR